jgi:hypothetical protein
MKKDELIMIKLKELNEILESMECGNCQFSKKCGAVMYVPTLCDRIKDLINEYTGF